MFSATVAVILLASVPALLAKERAAEWINTPFTFITGHFGIAYLAYGIDVLGFLIFLGASRYGKVVLGRRGDEVEFTTLTWVALHTSTDDRRGNQPTHSPTTR